MRALKKHLRFLLWFLFCFTFGIEAVKIVFELSPAIGHQDLSMANLFFWTSLLTIELIMGGMALYYIITQPSRRLRLIVLCICHFTVILILPMTLTNWSWTCILYPWPHSLQAFDPATPSTALYISLTVGFLVIPFLTFGWGAKGFCGYVCPHGAFFSETYGRLFKAHPGRLSGAAPIVPPVFFFLMVLALIVILIFPDQVVPLRSVQRFVYFFTAEFFYFVIGIPLLGGRSYCRLICPLGYGIRLMVRLKIKLMNR